LTYALTVIVKFGRIAAQLNTIGEQVKGRAFIVETDGALVASTTGTEPFNLDALGVPQRNYAQNCSESYIRRAWQLYSSNPQGSRGTYTIDDVEYFLLSYKYERDNIKWTIIHLAESDPFLGGIRAYLQ